MQLWQSAKNKELQDTPADGVDHLAPVDADVPLEAVYVEPQDNSSRRRRLALALGTLAAGTMLGTMYWQKHVTAKGSASALMAQFGKALPGGNAPMAAPLEVVETPIHPRGPAEVGQALPSPQLVEVAAAPPADGMTAGVSLQSIHPTPAAPQPSAAPAYPSGVPVASEVMPAVVAPQAGRPLPAMAAAPTGAAGPDQPTPMSAAAAAAAATTQAGPIAGAPTASRSTVIDARPAAPLAPVHRPRTVTRTSTSAFDTWEGGNRLF